MQAFHQQQEIGKQVKAARRQVQHLRSQTDTLATAAERLEQVTTSFQTSCLVAILFLSFPTVQGLTDVTKLSKQACECLYVAGWGCRQRSPLVTWRTT